MADLRALCEEAGMREPRTHLQTGNVIFRPKKADRRQLPARVEKLIHERHGFKVDTVVRTVEELREAVAKNPLTGRDRKPNLLVIMFLAEVPPPSAFRELRSVYDGPEEMALRGADLYLYYPNGQGRSKLTNALIERHLGVRGTARNLNTVAALAAM
jgi:uncharacterized protein (DUF1697 family)